MLRSLIIICLLFIGTLSNAVPNKDAWQKANVFYQQKQYDSAAAYYNQVAISKPQNATLYYNLGNTYYRLNNIGLAVLNYQKALFLDPGYKDAADNLALTESRISNRIPSTSDIFFIKWWHNLTLGSNTTMWSIISLLVFLVIITLGFFIQFKKITNMLIPQFVGVLFFILLGFLTLAFISAHNQLHSEVGVVIQNDAPLMNEQHTGKAQNLVPEGTTVTIIDQRPGWAEVRLPDGRIGWLQETLVNKI